VESQTVPLHFTPFLGILSGAALTLLTIAVLVVLIIRWVAGVTINLLSILMIILMIIRPTRKKGYSPPHSISLKSGDSGYQVRDPRPGRS
jgi:hypothetical protein